MLLFKVVVRTMVSRDWHVDSAYVVAPDTQTAIKKATSHFQSWYHMDEKRLAEDLKLLSVRVVNAVFIK